MKPVFNLHFVLIVNFSMDMNERKRRMSDVFKNSRTAEERDTGIAH